MSMENKNKEKNFNNLSILDTILRFIFVTIRRRKQRGLKLCLGTLQTLFERKK